MADTGETTIKETAAATDQSLGDSDNASKSDIHEDRGEEGGNHEPSAEHPDVEPSTTKPDGELIEKNDNSQSQEEEQKSLQMEHFGKEHELALGKSLTGDRMQQQHESSQVQNLQEDKPTLDLKESDPSLDSKANEATPYPVEDKPSPGPLESISTDPPDEKPDERQILETKSSLDPDKIKPSLDTTETKPLLDSVAAKQLTDILEAKSSPSPTEDKPSGDPKEAKSSADSMKTKPSADPTGEKPDEREILEAKSSPKPSGDPKEAKSSADSMKTKPSPDPTGEKPDERKLLKLLLSAGLGVLLGILYVLIFQSSKTQIPDSGSVLQKFQTEFKTLKDTFPEQSRHLWLRSEKMLQNHINKTDPREPATIILTAAQDAQHTLRCLGSGLATAYSAAVKAKWLMIDGLSQANLDSGTAKLHIDEALSSRFDSGDRAAVLSRLETLPSGSLLILYKYCDHENAAYKSVALVLTVLLDEPSLEADTPLTELEEKVRDFLYHRFIQSDGIRPHGEMDRDKLGGIWSRISHLVLPVFPVAEIEEGSCPFKVQ